MSAKQRDRIIWDSLARGKCRDNAAVVAACHRLIKAARFGWKERHDPADWALVQEFYEKESRG